MINVAKNFSYKKQQAVTLKASGLLNIDDFTIEIDGEDKDVKTLLRDFDGSEVILTVQTKVDEELEEPTEI